MSTETAPESDVLPRDPGEYRPGIHFGQRFHDRYEDDRPPRHLDGEIVEGCIRRGEARKVNAGVYWLRETFGGVTYRLVVNVSKGEVITGYPISVNTEAARASGRWSPQQIEDVREFIATDPRQE